PTVAARGSRSAADVHPRRRLFAIERETVSHLLRGTSVRAARGRERAGRRRGDGGSDAPDRCGTRGGTDPGARGPAVPVRRAAPGQRCDLLPGAGGRTRLIEPPRLSVGHV